MQNRDCCLRIAIENITKSPDRQERIPIVQLRTNTFALLCQHSAKMLRHTCRNSVGMILRILIYEIDVM